MFFLSCDYVFKITIVYLNLSKKFKITYSSEHDIASFSNDSIDILSDIFTSLEKIMKTNTAQLRRTPANFALQSPSVFELISGSSQASSSWN